MMLLASPLCIAIRAHQRDSDRISQIAFIERDQLIDDSNQLDAEKIYVRRDSAGCGCTKFLHRMGHVSIHGRAKHGLSLCAGMLSPKLYTKSNLICGERRVFRPFMRMKFHDVEEQGLPECWAAVLSSGGGLGGHGRLLKSFQPLIVAFVSAAMGDFLVFSDLVSSPSSSVATGAAVADRFVTEFAVDCWVIRRGPLGGVEDQPPSSFLLWKFDFALEMSPFRASSTAPREEGKMVFMR
uniref:Uncharacterized protein n=1 Tax=Fagus sylvatica TaxID=28930 RepID=A0A2N9J8V0_FAGSY